MTEIKGIYVPDEYKLSSVEKLQAYKNNPVIHSDKQKDSVRNSIETYGFMVPILCKEENGEIADGHLRLEVGEEFGMPKVPWTSVDHLSDAEIKGLRIAMQKTAYDGEFEDEELASELDELDDMDFDLELTGFEEDEIGEVLDNGAEEDVEHESLTEQFVVPPMSILDTRLGYWLSRKNEWLSLGIKSEVGRDDTLLGNKSREGYGGDYDLEKGESAWGGKGTSIFDPVLTEISYKWFCPDSGSILDSFAGGSVRGIVAGYLGYEYDGVELREEQVKANRPQADKILDDRDLVSWQVGDAKDVKELAGKSYDYLFSCPPYYDLEEYSDLDNELSAIESYEDFKQNYFEIIERSVDLLKDNRFATFVVGDIRDDDGFYRNFVSDTIAGFRQAGMELYNEAILITAYGDRKSVV